MSAHYTSRIVYPNRKQEARKRAIGFVFFAFCVFALVGLLGFGLYSFAQFEKFRIKNIAVEGTRALSQNEIRAYAERILDGSFLLIIPKNHYVFASSRRIADELQKEFPRIRSASVKKLFPDGIKIIVDERTEWGIYCGEISNLKSQISNYGGDVAATNTPLVADESDFGRQCGYVDRDGVLFEYPLEISGVFLPVISDDSFAEIREGKTVVSRDVISFFEVARDRAKQELGVAFVKLEILKELPDDYRLHTGEGWYALVPRFGDQAHWFSPMKVLFERELKNRAGLEYIDARFGNKLFYKRIGR